MGHKGPNQGKAHQTKRHDQGYGDLTKLNHDGLILQSIGFELLESFANEYLELLGTSSAIYEVNGDYAYGIFTSGWCRMMDSTSRWLCDTEDNAEALASGQWLCHESCWSDCAKRIIEECAPVDIGCHGGIRMYGVPILSNGNVIGAINFGYGDPPKDPNTLQDLAELYQLDYDRLIREAEAYESRPPFIIDLAKKQLHATARIIGSMIEAKQAEIQREKLQSQLQQAQKMESVGRLAGGIAHDFNNMMGVILGHAELALDQVDPGLSIHQNLLEIRKAAERSAELTAQLLAFARKQTVRPKVIDLNNEIRDMIAMIQRLIGEDIDFQWHPGDSIWSIQIDPFQVHQLLVNLCINAREAISGNGRIIIETDNTVLDTERCALQEQPTPGDYVMLSVSDNGCGIEDEVLPHIFEPFFTTRGIGKGTGMGLAIVHGIVKQNQGCINVYSEVGQGTTIQIYLPRYNEITNLQ